MSKPNVSAERKQQIVSATVECIAKYGYHNFSMQDVAKAAGVSKGIIHYYFLNKDELLLSVLEKVSGNIESLLADELKLSTDPEQRLKAFIKVTAQIVTNMREYYQVSMDFWTQINQKKEIKDVISNHYAKFRKSCADLITEGMDKGAFRKGNAMHYASLLVSIIDGLSLQWLFDETQIPYDQLVDLASAMIIKELKINGSPS
jgi:TetR/AcrR family transcriptional regulator, fatty acid metabolism regulator protein